MKKAKLAQKPQSNRVLARAGYPESEYFLVVDMTQQEAEAIARGELPEKIQNDVIGCIIGLRLPIAEHLERLRMKQESINDSDTKPEA